VIALIIALWLALSPLSCPPYCGLSSDKDVHLPIAMRSVTP